MQDINGEKVVTNDATGQSLVLRGGKWVPYSIPSSTPEQRYENWYRARSPIARNFLPSTMGQAGFAAGGLGVAGAAALGAPLSGGASLAIPIAMAIAGGAAGDPKNALSAGSWEGAKSALAEGVGALGAKGIDLGARFAFKGRMLGDLAKRVGNGLSQLFIDYPLRVPQTAQELEDQIPNGKLANAIGERLGNFRNGLGRLLKGYQLSMPDINPQTGKTEWHLMSVPEAIDHIKDMQTAGWSTAGSSKSGTDAWKYRQLARTARTRLISALNSYQPGTLVRPDAASKVYGELGDVYGELSGDYGAAIHVQKIFRQAWRPDAEIDQPALLKSLRNEMDDLAQFKGTRRAIKFRDSVSPTRAQAKMEMSPMMRMHGGEGSIRAMMHPPIPYKPETRSLIPQPWRALSDVRAAPVIGLAGEKGAEDVLEDDE